MPDIIYNPKQNYMLKCGRCGKTVFVVIVCADGVISTCQGCSMQYKLESVGGVHVKNA